MSEHNHKKLIDDIRERRKERPQMLAEIKAIVEKDRYRTFRVPSVIKLDC